MILHLLKVRFQKALEPFTDDPIPYLEMIRPSQDVKFGDYQANMAMSLGKKLGKPPREVAAEIVARLDIDGLCTPPEIAGPGFINLRITDSLLGELLQKAVGDEERLAIAPVAPAEKKHYVIDYSAPNVAKPMHVGHIRSTVIGNALAKMLKFQGHRVTTDNHLGDWGTQFGMIIFGYKNYLDAEAYQKHPVAELSRLYRFVRQKVDEPNEKIATAVLQETAKLHAGNAENLKIWKEVLNHSKKEIDRIYERLGISFDVTYGESHYHSMLADVVEYLLQQKIAVETEGAVGIFFEGEKVPMLIRKSDGAFLYSTTDLATVKFRLDEFKPNAILYVVDFRQSQHFDHLFKAVRKMGINDVELVHVKFGTVLGEDGKPFKTRSGDTVGLESLLDEAEEKAFCVILNSETRLKRILYGDNPNEPLVCYKYCDIREILDMWVEDETITIEQFVESLQSIGFVDCDCSDTNPEELRKLARRILSTARFVGLGALVYADLSQNRESDYVFSFDKMLAMNGNTATYMQYAYARVCSIFDKGKEEGIDVDKLLRSPEPICLSTPQERALALELLKFDEAIEWAIRDYRPNQLTAYLYELANRYSHFFEHCPVLKADDEAIKQSRLKLCDLTARTINLGLQLLGIETVERM